MPNTANIAQSILHSIKELSEASCQRLIIAYSGGIDSEVLAHAVSELTRVQAHLSAVLIHIHHGLSPDADDWVKHCESRALAYNLPLIVKKVAVKQGARLSIESEARRARYQALLSEMKLGDVLFTAHHQDDQLETLLLALKRGQGPKGLASMGVTQPLDNGLLQLRPLLDISRIEIEQYAKQYGLSNIEDDSNQDVRFDRNFLRLNVIPQLKQRWPAIATTACRSAELCREQQSLLDEVSEQKLLAHIQASPFAKYVLNINSFGLLPYAWQRQLFRTFLSKLDLPNLSKIQLDETLEQLQTAKAGAKVEIKASGVIVRRFNHQVYAHDYPQELIKPDDIEAVNLLELLAKSERVELKVNSLNTLIVEKTMTDESDPLTQLRLPKLNEVVSIRFGVAGSTLCKPTFRDKSRSLKKLWQELQVPPWERSRVPLLFYNEQLVCAIGYWVDKVAQADVESQSIYVRQN
ncbi:tRNA lysidine(34) synthetase TilS [Parashewanella spongiae]|uniref:tRNA(Ile)-lysidine synthase n=1 Tax=Parashewanella spongiae TaxID=342950 RepID=A0A3A6U123_9GAMM|nr:tRNA lysidine(34) synthetase TilS [Parashewanella spongiae]MCL1076980.1 tRNA lysidine(34) synthetase TilS [Parashewanella spongiae]RJY19085.1 tRNA lysidine(34) synthetase TilS [Parashewanella spongiae]